MLSFGRGLSTGINKKQEHLFNKTTGTSRRLNRKQKLWELKIGETKNLAVMENN